jgi:cytochrome c553
MNGNGDFSTAVPLCSVCHTNPVRQGKNRTFKHGYCKKCHRLDMKQRRQAKMPEAQILARAVKKLNRMLKGYEHDNVRQER